MIGEHRASDASIQPVVDRMDDRDPQFLPFALQLTYLQELKNMPDPTVDINSGQRCHR